ncbi:PxKF domain-containing protein, partial [Deinococcus malanensis]
ITAPNVAAVEATALMTAVTFAPTATDLVDGSRAVSCDKLSGSTFPVGETTVTCTSTDSRNNTSTKTFTVTVNFKFNGFFQPVDMDGVWNKAKAGSAIPVKFNLGDVKGATATEIFAATPKAVVVNCSTTVTQSIEETVTANTSGLQWDGTQYIYVWKTDSTMTGKCARFEVLLKDGSIARTALFTFTK